MTATTATPAAPDDFDPASNVVDVDVRYLRLKLGNDVIETVRGGMGSRPV